MENRAFQATPSRINPVLSGAALALGLLVAAAPAQAGSAILDKLRKGEPLVLAYRESSIPFSFLDSDKRPAGYAINLCQRIAEGLRQQLGLKHIALQYKAVTSSTRIDTIRNHQADMECGSTTNNAERREKVAFTVPHYIATARILVRADSTATELHDFSGKRLVSTRNTTSMTRVTQANQERLLGIHVIEVTDDPKAVDMVEKGEADGFVMDDVLLYALRAERADPNKLKVVGKALTIEPLAIMLPKDDPEFKQMVDEEMKRLIRSREAHALYEQWFMQPSLPRNVALKLPMGSILREFWKQPSDVLPF
jgi:ABC-type amino acid transport substrate-binding protein